MTGTPFAKDAVASAGRGAVGRTGELLAVVRDRGYTRSATPFSLSSGGTSHDYVDLRRAVSRGDDLRVAAEVVAEVLSDACVEYDAIGGMTMGADPVAHAVALLTGRSWFSVRKAEKSHGSRRRVEGAELRPGTRVVVFEDTTTTGRSLAEAVEVVAATGATVALACTILDRGESAGALFAAMGVPYRAILGFRDLGIDAVPGPGTAGTGRPAD
ncbi:MAG: orotate phosphoribosyltransferase [Actinomycetota bacterium]|nr:orotate phosphoribosyltransferase [Actinomycetota bacterium]